MRGHFEKAGVPSKYVVKEFPITPDAHVPVGMPKYVLLAPGVLLMNYAGTTLSALHFVPGQFVDVAANSYAGCLYRYLK